ncbi:MULTISPECIES: hypothetical protein [Sphaerospermopsis]|uniref:hypothetical protein n=1 Tax=Sphaerospermopsis TaxID=752201 RepID=UPI001681379F|nr:MULTISPECIES: hypothetical protein [Sphaerospermopsis]MBD2145839.1 hypothetical protein [Sphaerospermopsis sp. FACHB-1194]
MKATNDQFYEKAIFLQGRSIRATNDQFYEKAIFRMLRPYFARTGVRSKTLLE